MLLVPTYVAASPLEGVGTFAARAIARGEPVWAFARGIDLLIPDADLVGLPEAFRAFLDRYAYRSSDVPGGLILPCDHARFLNHSENPNIESKGLRTHALRDIAEGDELLCDYRQVAEGWSGF